jgi:hypothetical protein
MRKKFLKCVKTCLIYRSRLRLAGVSKDRYLKDKILIFPLRLHRKPAGAKTVRKGSPGVKNAWRWTSKNLTKCANSISYRMASRYKKPSVLTLMPLKFISLKTITLRLIIRQFSNLLNSSSILTIFRIQKNKNP